jgi:ABC-type Fe3+ transport system permease subunit
MSMYFRDLTFLFFVGIYAVHYNLGRYTMDILGLILLAVGGICLALALFILSLDPPPRHPGEETRKTRQS